MAAILAGNQDGRTRWSGLVGREWEIGLVLGCPAELVPCCAPGVPVAGAHGGEADLDAEHPDFQAVCVSGKGLPGHLSTLMASDG